MAGDSENLTAGRELAVLLPLALEGPYTYRCPDHLDAGPGDYVQVPLGPRQIIGVVWGEGTGDVASEKLRPITEKLDAAPMSAVQRRFVDWVADYTLSSPGTVLRMTLRVPAALGPVRQKSGVRRSGDPPARMTPQRQRVLDTLQDEFVWPIKDLAQEAGVTTGVVRGLVDSGTLAIAPLPAFDMFQEPQLLVRDKELSEVQREAADALRDYVQPGRFSVCLLDGVTGSGKTEVYLEAISQALAAGGQALVMLPEIALTAQFIERIEQRFGARPAEWHSGLRPGERERVWRGISDGTARIVVGARSALFLPFQDLAIIVVDEEHDPAFKQEDGVHYHARDMAVVRASLGGLPVVLSSATPALESLYNVEKGRYSTVRLEVRHGIAVLPEISCVDMRTSGPERGKWLSPTLHEAVAKTLADGQQALLFLNRRGYAPLTLCRTCGYRLNCPNCDTWLVEHRFRRQLLCHHCGHQTDIPKTCPACDNANTLVACGPGVERLAEEVEADFPDARIAILSSDIMRGITLKEMLKAITDGEFDIVIGTQLVAKGHNFPGLTLVGVVDADIGLASGDPRAAERTYQLLRQVAGRAGRGDKPGRAMLQTYQPENALMEALVSGDREEFYSYERQARETFDLPPYGRLAGVVVAANDNSESLGYARLMARAVPSAQGVRVLGPAPAPIAQLRGRHRIRFLVKSVRDFNIQGFLRAWLGAVAPPKGSVRVTVDIDPQSFL